MANTVFQHKRSGTPASVPSVLEFGELAINYADGLIFYKNTTSHIVSISGGGGGNAFGTINANGTLVVSDTAGDVLNLVAGTNVTFSVDAVNDIITINASGGGGDVSAPFAVANAAFLAANSAFSNGNTTHTLTIASFGAANASFANGNTNFTTLQTVFGVANAGFLAANSAFANANGTHTLTVASFGAANAAFSNANSTHTLTIASFAAANASYANTNTTHTLAIAAFTQANTALANTSGVAFNGTLYFPSGNVGIGTATPNHALHIVRAGSNIPNFVIEGDGEQTMRFRNANNTLGASTRVSWKLANRWNTDWQFIWYTDTSDAGANNIVLIGNGTGGNQTLFYGDANTGNVAIGRTTADYKLDVNGSVNASALLVNGLPISGGSASNVQVFDVSGVWTKPSTGTTVYVRMWGGGGAGAKGGSSGGGGGGGGYNERIFLFDDLGASENVTVGAGGTGGTGSGPAGGSSIFGSWMIAGGGGGSGSGSGSAGGGGGGGGPFGSGNTSTTQVGAGGANNQTISGIAYGTGNSSTGTADSISFIGGGGSSVVGDSFGFGGGGGGSGGVGGGFSLYGAGGGGGGTTGTALGGRGWFDGGNGASGTSSTVPTRGEAPGGGGGGTRTGATAGSGANGRVIIYVF